VASSNLQNFPARMKARSLEVRDGVDKVLKRAAIEVDQKVVFATPVDTGRARSNWIASIGGPAGGTRGAFSPGSKLGLGEGNNAQAAISAARFTINSRSFKQAIFISNNLDYIGDLNNGSSQQAAANFVRQGVQAGAGVIKTIKVFKV
jgi:hypothetical protein